MKLKLVDLGSGTLAPTYRHWCPGCKANHVIYTDPKAQGNGHYWRFNGDMISPTFEPSINIVGQCHYFIRSGQIQYCGDSNHKLAGQTVDMVELENIGESDW